MAKSKRKIYSSQRDELAIAIAKHLKQSGIISKQANLHSGRYISRGVLKKVKEHQAAARLNYGTVKVSKAIAEAAKQRGYTVVQGNRIVGPKTPSFRNRLKSGEITGVKPVKGGFMEELYLPHTIYDLRSLIEQLEEDGIDSLKLPGEHFAFKYKGAESYRAFMNSKDLLQYLQHYKGIMTALNSNKTEDLQEEFEAITIFRLHRDDISKVIPGVKERRERKKRERREAIARGEYFGKPIKRKRTRAEWLATLPQWRQDKIRDRANKAQKKQLEKLKQNPAKLKEYREKAAARSKAWREAQKNK